jgi:hypothetical protein
MWLSTSGSLDKPIGGGFMVWSTGISPNFDSGFIFKRAAIEGEHKGPVQALSGER